MMPAFNKAAHRQLARLVRKSADHCKAGLIALLEQPTRKALVKPMKKARIQQEKQKRLTKKEETARIRAAVFARAGDKCELTGAPNPTEMHHLIGGNGRRRQQQSVENCMAVIPQAHRAYHLDPRAFRLTVDAWCAYYGYPPINRIEHAPVWRAG